MTNEELAKLTAGFRSAVDAMSTSATALLTGLASLSEDGDDADLDAEAEAAAEEARAAVLAKRSAPKTPVAPVVTERSAAEKAQVLGLRGACKKRGLEAEFDALEATGAPVSDLREVLVAGLRTSKGEISNLQAPSNEDPAKGAGKRGKLNGWDESKSKPGK